MRAILIGSTRIVLEQITRYSQGSMAGEQTIRIRTTSHTGDMEALEMMDRKGHVLATLDSHFQLVPVQGDRT